MTGRFFFQGQTRGIRKQEADGTTNFRERFAAGNPGALAGELGCLRTAQRQGLRLREQLQAGPKLPVALAKRGSTATPRRLRLRENSADAAP